MSELPPGVLEAICRAILVGTVVAVSMISGVAYALRLLWRRHIIETRIVPLEMAVEVQDKRLRNVEATMNKCKPCREAEAAL